MSTVGRRRDRASAGRTSITILMALVLLSALDCTVLRYPMRGRPQVEFLLVLGGLPMANILAVAMLLCFRRLAVDFTERRWLTGFLWSGCGAMLAVAGLALRSPDAISTVVATMAYPASRLGSPAFLPAAALLFLAPQLATALAGGALYHRYGHGQWTDGPGLERAGEASGPASA